CAAPAAAGPDRAQPGKTGRASASPLAERRIVAGVVFFHHAHPLVAEMPRLRLYDNRAGPFRTMVGTGTPGTWQQRARPGEALLSGHTLRRRPTGGLSCL